MVLGANELPSLNDITVTEAREVVTALSDVDPVLANALGSGMLEIVSTGTDLPVIDLGKSRTNSMPPRATPTSWCWKAWVGALKPITRQSSTSTCCVYASSRMNPLRSVSAARTSIASAVTRLPLDRRLCSSRRKKGHVSILSVRLFCGSTLASDCVSWLFCIMSVRDRFGAHCCELQVAIC